MEATISNPSQWSTTDANNNATPPDGWPETTMLIPQINDSARANMGGIARWFQDTNGTLVTAGAGNDYTLTTNSNNQSLGAQSLLVCISDRANTGAATLAVDGLAAKSIHKNGDLELLPGDIKADQTLFFAYNATNDDYQLLSLTGLSDKLRPQFAASDRTPDSDDDGVVYAMDTSGGNRTITLPDSPAVGYILGGFKQTADANTLSVLTQGSNVIVGPGSLTSHVHSGQGDGDVLIYIGSDIWWPLSVSWKQYIASQGEAEAGTSNSAIMTPLRTAEAIAEQAGEGTKGWVLYQPGTGILASFNVASVSPVGSGQFDVFWQTDFATANYVTVATAETAAGTRIAQVRDRAAGSVRLIFQNSDGDPGNPDFFHAASFGVQ